MSEWVPVERSLPPVGQKVVVYLPDTRFVSIGHLCADSRWRVDSALTIKKFCAVSHWMHIPPVPRALMRRKQEAQDDDHAR